MASDVHPASVSVKACVTPKTAHAERVHDAVAAKREVERRSLLWSSTM